MYTNVIILTRKSMNTLVKVNRVKKLKKKLYTWKPGF